MKVRYVTLPDHTSFLSNAVAFCGLNADCKVWRGDWMAYHPVIFQLTFSYLLDDWGVNKSNIHKNIQMKTKI